MLPCRVVGRALPAQDDVPQAGHGVAWQLQWERAVRGDDAIHGVVLISGFDGMNYEDNPTLAGQFPMLGLRACDFDIMRL